jgi:hypothetical protein
MKKLFMVLCVVIMFFGLVGCPSDDPTSSMQKTSTISSTPVATQNGGTTTATVPEPATLLLLGSGLVALAAVGRKKFFKKDKAE